MRAREPLLGREVRNQSVALEELARKKLHDVERARKDQEKTAAKREERDLQQERDAERDAAREADDANRRLENAQASEQFAKEQKRNTVWFFALPLLFLAAMITYILTHGGSRSP